MPKSPEDIQQLAGEAARIWNSKLVQQYFEAEIQQVFIQWLTADTLEKREMLWNLAQGMDRFKMRFQRFMSEGKALDKKGGGIADSIGPII